MHSVLREAVVAMTVMLVVVAAPPKALAGGTPWGTATVEDFQYRDQRVVFDVTVDSVERLNAVLDRASYLAKLNEANPFDNRIVLVLHGGEIPFFATENYTEHEALMRRAKSLTAGEVIEFRMCKEAAAGHGYEPKDIHGFVTIVPMAEAEIIRWQQEGFAYLQY